jgi:uncharacterized membrane protein YdjX (TVP38/TMEM64 family)
LTPKKNRTQKQQRQIAGAGVALFLLLSALVLWKVGLPMVRLASQPEAFRLWVEGYGWWGRLIYMGMVFLQVLVAVIPGEPLEIAGGYVFGAVEGTILCLLAASLGSFAVIALVRRFGVYLVEVFFSREKINSLRFLRDTKGRTILFFLLFMVPGTPKDLLSYGAGLLDIPLPALFLICSLGRIPSVVTSTIGGDALGTQSYGFAVAVFLVTMAISGLGLFLYHRISQKNNENHPDKNNGGKS